MADLHELLAALRNPDGGELSPTIYDDIDTAYADLTGGWDAKTSEYEASIADLTSAGESKTQAYEAEISRLKSMLFDKLTAEPVAPVEVDGNSDDDDNNSSNNDNNPANDINDLFV